VQGGCEEDDAIVSPGDDEPPLINDGEYEDREDRCEGGFDGHGSPVNDCFRKQGDVRNITVTDNSAQSILLKGDESEGIIRDRSTNGGLLIRRDVDQPQCDDTDMEEKEKEETEELVQARESSVDDDADDDDDDDEEEEEETQISPVPDIEPEVCKRFLLIIIFLRLVPMIFSHTRKMHVYDTELMFNHFIQVPAKQILSHCAIQFHFTRILAIVALRILCYSSVEVNL
jgi:hypothetical protein